ncbi:MAG: VanW family protein [Lachnospiraceae bacterium]|nr:VanW family protein [Lachnospiraceae bacterium]
MKKLNCIRISLLMLLCICVLVGSVINTSAASKTVTMTPTTFDMDYYYNTNPDLQIAIGYDYDALYKHYLKYGLKEGRSGSEEFNCKAYMNNYADLRAAFKNDYASYCLHYEQYGKAENRNASVQFEPDAITVTTTSTNHNVLGSYSTNYDATVQRATNVELAASRINGVVLQPGQEFSYSQTILPRTPENGYVEATVISGGEYTIGYGGGICQVSSTLYAAMLNAGLPATERHPHSLPVSYVPEGMDATIASTVKDLKFENIFNKPIQITATTEDGILTVTIIEN